MRVNIVLAIGVLSLLIYGSKYLSESMQLVGWVIGMRFVLSALIGVVLSPLAWLFFRSPHSDQNRLLLGVKLLTGLSLIITSLLGVGSTLPGELLESFR